VHKKSVGERRASHAERRASRAEITDPAVVMEAAAAFLAVRPRSVAETRRRLGHLGYSTGVVDTVVERLVAMEYLDDDSFAHAWVESRDRARPRGENALRRELALKGVPRDVVDAVLAERQAAGGGDTSPDQSPDHRAAVALLARRRASLERELDPRMRRQKAYALLARNGFPPDVCSDAANALVAAADSVTED
jgi:regulatory protein